MDPGNVLPTHYLQAYSGGRILGVASLFITLDLLFVAFREVACLLSKAAWGCDDYFLAPALITNLGVCIQGMIIVKVAGVGCHLEAALMRRPDHIPAWGKSIYTLQMIYFPAPALPKLSILYLYYRLFPTKVFRILTLVIASIVVMNLLANLFAATWVCSPIAYLWDKSIAGGRCFDSVLYRQMVNVPNIVTDAAMLACLTICFLAGSIGLIAPCARLAALNTKSAFKDNTWQSVNLVSWTIVEPSMYLIAACLLGLRPLFSQTMICKIRLILTRASNLWSTNNDIELQTPQQRCGGFQRLDKPLK
ncbi:MAG: hypothetical protein Q9221_009075 [Calogaya cf. arnoldii]